MTNADDDGKNQPEADTATEAAPAPLAVAPATVPLAVTPAAAPPAAPPAAGASPPNTPPGLAGVTRSSAIDAAVSVGLSASRLVYERPNARGQARRDVHRKHHGMVAGFLEVNADVPVELRHGVFAKPGAKFDAWIRFSSSSKRAQSDTVGDGRGVAIKLLDVPGARLLDDQNVGVQDFLFLNGPAFFAPTAEAMAVAAQLEADDKFPSGFFLSSGNLGGLAALLRMASTQADSLLDITYFSQAPYRLGNTLLVKHRLRPLRQKPHAKVRFKGTDYLFKALKDDLAKDASEDPKFELAVQLRGTPESLFPEDDATVVWDEQLSPFVPVAVLTLPRQDFATEERMALAEDSAFSPWNGLLAHEPRGSINLARKHAYDGSQAARFDLNGKKAQPDYRHAFDHRDDAGQQPAKSPELEDTSSVWQAIKGAAFLTPGLAKLPERILSSWLGYGLAPLALITLILAGELQCSPVKHWYCSPLRIAPNMPSEALIPPAILTTQRLSQGFGKPGQLEKDPKWNFRYAAVGAEGNGGIPYWIYRVLPKMFPQNFGGRTDFSQFGLSLEDDTEYYQSYHGLPRGLILTEPVANFAGNKLELGLHLVTFNCASCHRGEYLDKQGHSQFVDGMPNLGIDTAGYKRAVFDSMTDPAFTPANVIDAINQLLELEHGTQLTATERVVYELVVGFARAQALKKPLEWLKARPPNGPGRLDAFGALRFEFLGYENEKEVKTLATVDLPSIWHQQDAWRPWHHWDGNTAEPRARNFGAIIGIGGKPETLRKNELSLVGHWITQEIPTFLEAPPFPLGDPDPPKDAYDKGKALFEAQCANCHGRYEGGKLVQTADCMRRASASPDTDPHRFEAIDQTFLNKLNDFGAKNSIWGPAAFKKSNGYLCPPLDGIWARAPYLHNGSVPTLWHLLADLKDRPAKFQRGNPAYDVEKGGFVWDKAPVGRPQFELDTSLIGNSNVGHLHPVPESDRRALITYLLTL